MSAKTLGMRDPISSDGAPAPSRLEAGAPLGDGETTAWLLDLLKRYFGYDSFRPLQEEIIRDTLNGRDVFALLPTGGGKSLCYQLPAVARNGLTLVVSPLIALMKDQVDALQEAGIAATFLNSSLDEKGARARFRGLHQNEYRLLYVSPERLALPGFIETLKGWPVEQFAIDEAHCISEWGHDFRPEYRQLENVRAQFPGVPFMALTATATDRVRADIVKHLKLKDPGVYVASFNRPNLTYRVWPKNGPYEQLLTFIKKRPNDCGIVYCLSRRGAEDNAERLREDGIKAVAYHAGLDGAERVRNQELFLRDEARVVCATIAFGMGINKPNVRFVVHYDLPKHIEGYYQETGRAGRDGLPSECVLLYSAGDVMKLTRFIDDVTDPQEQEIARKQLNQMVHYAECSSCRRAELLKYFSEIYPEADCASCDNCLAPRPSYDGTVDAQKFLSCIYRINQCGVPMGMKHTVDVLLGANTEGIRSRGHDKISTYGVGKEHDAQEWQRIGRELMRLGLCKQASGKYTTLDLTSEGRAVLTQRKTVTLTKPPPEKEVKEARHAGEILCDEALFERLRVLRKRLADARNIPAYVVFNDSTLRLMAQRYPVTAHEFSRVSGVGEKKLADFGEAFINEILDYLTTHPKQVFAQSKDLALPLEERADLTSSEPTLPGLNESTSESVRRFNRGQSVEQIARARGVTQSTIYSHLVDATKAGMSFPMERVAPPAELERIRAALAQHGQAGLKPAFEALGGTVNYDVLRMVRALSPGGADAARVASENLALRKEELRTVFPNAYAPWTEDEDKRLLVLFAQKKTVETISAELGRQPAAINARYLKLTDPQAAGAQKQAAPATKPKWTSDDEMLLRALVKAGKKMEQLALIMQRPAEEIDGKLREMGL
ncbi:MAG TPA: DNA helicase RecQ [Planctomycetota bacterium]|nr:DNA helicase RecQ [Planctomycetota bacterium]